MQWQTVAEFDLNFGTSTNGTAHLHAERGNNIGFATIGQLNKRQSGRTVGIILDRQDLGLINANKTEVNDAQGALCTTTTMANSNFALVVTTRLLLTSSEQRLFGFGLGDLSKVRHTHVAARTGIGFENFDSHYFCSSKALIFWPFLRVT